MDYHSLRVRLCLAESARTANNTAKQQLQCDDHRIAVHSTVANSQSRGSEYLGQ